MNLPRRDFLKGSLSAWPIRTSGLTGTGGAASWDRKDGQGFVMRHAAGFKFNNTEIDAL